MSTHNPERTGTNRPDSWNDQNELTGPTGIPPEGERHEDYFPSSGETRWFQKRGVQIAGAALGLLSAGGVALGLSQSGEKPTPAAPENNPATSAPQTPGEPTAPETTQSPEVQPASPAERIGVSNTDSLETLNTRATPELIEEALKPVTSAEFAPEAAYERLREIDNLRELAGEVNVAETVVGEISPATAESVARTEALLANVYTPNVLNSASSDLTDERAMPAFVAMEFELLEMTGRTKAETPTWEDDTVVTSFEQVNETTWNVQGTTSLVTNFNSPNLDGDRIYQNFPRFDESVAGRPFDATLVLQPNGQYLIDRM